MTIINPNSFLTQGLNINTVSYFRKIKFGSNEKQL